MDFEARLQQLYERFLRPGDTCVDVGAHTGRHTVPMARCVAPQGRVFAFEPIPAIADQLAENVKALGPESNVTLYRYALCDEEGESDFVLAVDNPAYSGLRERTYDTPTKLATLHVLTRRLDDILANLDALRYVKIDVEGGEWGVLRGAAGLIGRFRPRITFEFGLSSYAKYDVDPAEVFAFFTARDYIVTDILGRRLDGRQFAESSVKQEVWDYVAFPLDAAQELEALFRDAPG
jgi:FkbM family methyltransferase